MFRTAENVTIAYISGRFDPRESMSNVADTSSLRSYFTRADVNNLCELSKVRLEEVHINGLDMCWLLP